jgi:hypothetical protein
VSGRSRAESQVGVRLMGVWRVSYSNIQEFFYHPSRKSPQLEGRLRLRRLRRLPLPLKQGGL